MSPALIWFILGIALCILEALHLGFVLLWFGLGAIAAAGAALFTPAWEWPTATFAVVSLALLIWTRPLALRFFRSSTGYQTSIERLVGREAVVVKTVQPNRVGEGQVRVDGNYWSAVSSTAEPIPPGARVVVARVESAHLVVELP